MPTRRWSEGMWVEFRVPGSGFRVPGSGFSNTGRLQRVGGQKWKVKNRIKCSVKLLQISIGSIQNQDKLCDQSTSLRKSNSLTR